MALKRNTKVDASFALSSMTDIVFLLLIFFLVYRPSLLWQ